MYTKAIALIVGLILAFAGAITFLSNGLSLIPARIIESEHSRLQDEVREKLLSAEMSLMLQGEALSQTASVVSSLSSVHDKLLQATPQELKEQTKNRWNNEVFEALVDWRAKRGSQVVQSRSEFSDLKRAERGSMMDQTPVQNWWGRSPDLVLAFAAVPLKTGVLSSTLVAQGEKGKELKAGKRFDADLPVLSEVAQTHEKVFGHFAWDGKMYAAVVAPVLKDGAFVGSVVVGMEMSRDVLSSFARYVPDYVSMALVYSKPQWGKEGKRVVFASDETRETLETSKFQSSGQEIDYHAIEANKVYASKSGGAEVSISRVPWMWSEKESSDVLFMTDTKAGEMVRRTFQAHMYIVCVVLLFLGIIGAVVLVARLQKKVMLIRKGLAEAMTSGEPVDGQALALLMGEKEDNLQQYRMLPVEPDPSETPEDWSEMMMDFDNDANAQSDKAMTKEEMAKLKEDADIKEATELYEKYMRLRKENNILAPMDFDCFLRRLYRNVDKIKKTYHCDSVHFEVHVSDGNVLLKPKIVKKS